ncbi:hypothetical protein B0H17DRAFT_1066380 [Mycena rosella]|uniref:AttH domain-containing protein n=1 Tax=Mycena rosella TaxID=1033263 RepID=A0AAD7GHK6_MYCRO|nr:hypothetical protein B0H17DRAFT_1066380 [Mycena rosella]
MWTRPPFLAFIALVFAKTCCTAKTVYNISVVDNAPSTVDFISSDTGLDAPKVRPINASAIDWWYFDVVSTDPKSRASVVVVFSAGGMPGMPLRVQATVSFPNGTLTSTETPVPAESATVTAEGNGSSGDWHGSGITWRYSAPSGTYDILIDSPDLDMKGQIHFQPAHYPCGPALAGQNLEVGPNIGWANALPDAAATVNLMVGGTRLAEIHGQNWTPQPFGASVELWYWGHGRVGPYSVVWFDFLDLNGTEYGSAYVAKDKTILAASCDLRNIRVRPSGENATYPPGNDTGFPSGYHITLDLGAEGVLEMDASVVASLMSAPSYGRFVGNLTGSVTPVRGAGGYLMSGVALFEQFRPNAFSVIPTADWELQVDIWWYRVIALARYARLCASILFDCH